MFAVFTKGFQTHGSALEFALLKILKCLYVTKEHSWLWWPAYVWRWCSIKM